MLHVVFPFTIFIVSIAKCIYLHVFEQYVTKVIVKTTEARILLSEVRKVYGRMVVDRL